MKKGGAVKTGFGDHLKTLILKAGYPSVEKFALENGFDRVTIYRIVARDSNPKLSTLIRLLKALEVEPNDLIPVKK